MSALAQELDSQWMRRNRRGSIFVYGVVAMTALCGISMLAVDWGHVQLVKTDLQSCADATARGYIQYYKTNGKTYANSNGPALYATSANPVDATGNYNGTVTVTWGSWNATTKTFTAGSSSTPIGVRVTVSRTAANSNAVKLFWGSLFKKTSIDVTASATAYLDTAVSGTVNVSATANPYLAGMPAGTTNLYGDDFSTAAPYQMTAVPVIPGSWITLTNVTGSANILPGYVSNSDSNGLTAIPVHHGQNFDYSINTPGSENGIADAIMPEGSFSGMFLGSAAPDSSAAPATIDWTQTAQNNLAAYGNIQLKQPFLIGDGTTNNGTVKRFQVPQGATRMYLSVWDGVAWYNNTGSLSATITVDSAVRMGK